MTALADASTRSLFSPATLNRRRGKIFYWTALTIAAVVFAFVFAFPLYWMAASGLKGTQEVIQSPPTWFPKHLVFSNYADAWKQLDIAKLLLNTFVYAGGALAFQLVFSVTAAFSLSKLRPVFGNVVLFLMLATLMVPASVLVLPTYLTVLNMPLLHVSLVNSPWAIWLPSVANGFNIFILKRFFDSLPEELLAAAAVDGAGPLRTLWSVVLPTSRAVTAVITLFYAVGYWNTFFNVMLYLPTDSQKWPLQYVLYEYVNLGMNMPGQVNSGFGVSGHSQTALLSLQMAVVVLTLLPIMLVFPFMQKHFAKGMLTGAIKG